MSVMLLLWLMYWLAFAKQVAENCKSIRRPIPTTKKNPCRDEGHTEKSWYWHLWMKLEILSYQWWLFFKSHWG